MGNLLAGNNEATELENGAEASSGTARQNFSSHVTPLQVKNLQNSSSGQNPVSLESETIITSKIQQLAQLESPQLRELARRLSYVYKVETPRYSKGRAPSPYANINVGARWKEIQGSKNWDGLLDPIDPVLRAEIVRYGEFGQATYDAFDSDKTSKYYGSCKYGKDVLLEKAGLDNRGYEITDYLYATSQLPLPYFVKATAADAWSRDSNWMGFVAVSTSTQEIARLGRRDITVSWRGTIKPLEWVEDAQVLPTLADLAPEGHTDVYVESGFLSVYKSCNAQSRYNKTSARDQVIKAVSALVEKYKDEDNLSITVIGHSLGSALATLCAYDIAESGLLSKIKPSGDGIPISVVSFGGPRVGNEAFKTRVNALKVAVLRVANTHDWVPKVPGLLANISPYKHVGVQITVDNLLSDYLVETTNIADVHNLELYMHLVDGFHSSKLPFKPTLRDYALVNKGGAFLKSEYYIPSFWWVAENKGLVRDKDGHWVVPVPDRDLFPPTPTSAAV